MKLGSATFCYTKGKPIEDEVVLEVSMSRVLGRDSLWPDHLSGKHQVRSLAVSPPDATWRLRK